MGIWLPNAEDEKRFGLDISQFQGMSDFDKMKSVTTPKAVDFVGIRYGISWGYVDNKWTYNWTEAKRVGIPRMAYHVVYPGEDVKRQMNHFLDAFSKGLGEGAPVLDVELHHNFSKARVTETVQECFEYLKIKVGRTPIIYSRPSFVSGYMLSNQSWYNDAYWWMAMYTYLGKEHDGTGLLTSCNKVGILSSRVIIHQTSSRGQGSYYGAESADLDYNRWLGSEELYQKMFNQPNTEPEPQPEIEIEVVVPSNVDVKVTKKQ